MPSHVSHALCGLVAMDTIIYEQMSALQLQISVRAEGFSCCIPLVLIASLILS